jgi:hypothetical protein
MESEFLVQSAGPPAVVGQEIADPSGGASEMWMEDDTGFEPEIVTLAGWNE